MAIPKEEVIELLSDIEDFLDNYSDIVDDEHPEPRPNRAMKLQDRVMDLRNELEGL